MGLISRSCVALSTAFLATALLAVQPASAQQSGTVKATYGAWSVLCDKPAGAQAEQCVLMQNVLAEDRPEIGLSVAILKTADRKSKILRVLAPLGVLLSPFEPYRGGLGLTIDDKYIGRTEFVRCFSDGCYAEVNLDEDLLKVLRNGKTAVFSVKESIDEENGIGIPVDLKGFGEGYDNLP